MAVTIELACTKSALVDQANPNTNYSGQSEYDLYSSARSRRLFLAFESLPQELRNFRIIACRLKLPISGSPGTVGDFFCASDFDANSITWETQPELEADTSTSTGMSPYFLPNQVTGGGYKAGQRLTSPAFAVYAVNEGGLSRSYVINPANAKLVVEYDPDETAGSQVSATTKPDYINPRNAYRFAWRLSAIGLSYNTVNGVTQASAVFYWRSGDSGDFTAVPVTGAEQSVTVPENTFPVGAIQFYIQATDAQGNTSQTAILSAATADAQISAQQTSPINSVEDGGSSILFSWSISSPNGTVPTKFSIAWRLADSSDFSYVDDIPGTARSYEMPADTFPAGTIYWTVRAYNADGVGGQWPAQVPFISVAAPAAPRVNTGAAPFATITWQVEGQQAYRLTVDGKAYGPFFGTGKSFTLPDYLADGQHTATVEVQGLYGLWSQPGAITFNVENVPGDELTLQGSFGTDAALTWQTESQTADFLIYRDGVQIGHTAGNSFSDRLVLGQHSYQVVNRLPDGNYTASNEINGCLRSCVTQIALAAGGDWIALRLSENQMNEEQFSYSRTYSLRHISGAEYPVLELSPYLDGSARYNTAFATLPEAQAFEALKGQVVILKSRGGNVVIGALTDLQKRNGEFYIAYEFTIQRCHWEDFVDDADG